MNTQDNSYHSVLRERIQSEMMDIMRAMQNIRIMATQIWNDVRRQDTEISNHFVILRRTRRTRRTIENVSANPPIQSFSNQHPNTRRSTTRTPRSKPVKTPQTPLTTIVLELCNEPIQNKKHECPICYVNVLSKSLIITNCQHNFCNNCMSKIITKTRENVLRCPMCREDICVLKFNNKNNYEKMKKKQQKIVENSQIPA